MTLRTAPWPKDQTTGRSFFGRFFLWLIAAVMAPKIRM
jgi:hypothetical protein